MWRRTYLMSQTMDNSGAAAATAPGSVQIAAAEYVRPRPWACAGAGRSGSPAGGSDGDESTQCRVAQQQWRGLARVSRCWSEHDNTNVDGNRRHPPLGEDTPGLPHWSRPTSLPTC